MKKYLLLFCLVAVSAFISIKPADGQLILSNQKLKIVTVEPEFNRLQCRVHEANKGNVQYILIDGNTKFSTDGRELTYKQAWDRFKPDMIIRVKGGMTVTGHIKAKQIYW